MKEYFRGFWSGGTFYDSIETYQKRLYHHMDKLRPPLLMLMHGDCHSRNIMLDECYDHIKLIDLDKIDYAGDYIMDIALLIEDAALFRRLFDDSYYYYLRPEQIDLPADGVQINYPHFVSEASMLFQQTLCEQVDEFANEIGDRHYKARLWLAIALYLLRMVEKAEHFKSGTVLYAEAIRLLHTLVEHLETGKPLPFIPIARSAAPTAAQADISSPSAPLEQIHRIILECARACSLSVQASPRTDGKSTRYFVEQQSRPYAMLDGKRRLPRVLLRCTSDVLQDVHGYVQTIQETGAFHTVLRLPEQFDVQIVRDLLIAAFRHTEDTAEEDNE